MNDVLKRNMFSRCGIVGGGAWGTALACAALRAGRDALLWARSERVIAEIRERGENVQYLPGVRLNPRLSVTHDLSEVASWSGFLLLAVPAQSLRAVVERLAPLIHQKVALIVCAKGIEQISGTFMDRIVAETSPGSSVAILSGPGFAADVAVGRRVSVSLACADEVVGHALCRALFSSSFQPFFTSDLVGVQLGGAMKNVLAIACGVLRGRGAGESALAALMTFGFEEMVCLGRALGASPETLGGLSGLGDLILTGYASRSRNMKLGMAIGAGRCVADLLREVGGGVKEGVYTAESLARLARERGIAAPIVIAVKALLSGRIDADEMIRKVLAFQS